MILDIRSAWYALTVQVLTTLTTLSYGCIIGDLGNSGDLAVWRLHAPTPT